MKTIKILASTFIFLALNVNVNSFATDKSDNTLNTIEANKSNIASVLIGNGRNKSLRNNIETLANIEKDMLFYTNAGRNKKPIDLFISMY